MASPELSTVTSNLGAFVPLCEDNAFSVAWEVREMDVIGMGQVTFTVTVAAVKSTNTVGAGIQIWTNSTTVTFNKTSSGSGSISYAYDNNGNRTNRTEGVKLLDLLIVQGSGFRYTVTV